MENDDPHKYITGVVQSKNVTTSSTYTDPITGQPISYYSFSARQSVAGKSYLFTGIAASTIRSSPRVDSARARSRSGTRSGTRSRRGEDGEQCKSAATYLHASSTVQLKPVGMYPYLTHETQLLAPAATRTYPAPHLFCRPLLFSST
jgi:hypothetical protein